MMNINTTGNEYEFIAGGMTGMNSTLGELEKAIYVQKKEMRQSILEKAARGNIHSNTGLRMFSQLAPDFPEEYAVVLFSLPSGREDALELTASRKIYENLHTVLTRVKFEHFSLLASIRLPVYNREKEIDDQFAEIRNCCSQICSVMKKIFLLRKIILPKKF